MLIPALPGELESSILAMSFFTESSLTGLKEKDPGLIIFSPLIRVKSSSMALLHSASELRDSDVIDVKKTLNNDAISTEVEADWTPYEIVEGMSWLETSDLSLMDDL